VLLATAVIAAIVLVAGSLVVARTFRGTPKADKLTGTAKADVLIGKRGADFLRGRGGPDRLFGRAGNDRLDGGRGPDRLVGGRGYDSFNGNAGVQNNSAAGNDVIVARDGREDFVNCGGGHDVAYVDLAEEGMIGCEEINAK
jgi:Ca2+-binding RTX toxin-like protein